MDRRQFSRAAVAWPVSMLTGKGSINGTVRNISLGGALIYCEELPDLSEPVRMGIEIPDYNHAILAAGRIVRSDIYHVDNASPSYGLGVRFSECPEEELKFFLRDELIGWRSALDTARKQVKSEQDGFHEARYAPFTKDKGCGHNPRKVNQTKLSFVLISVAIMVFLILFITFLPKKNNDMKTDQIRSLETRIQQLETSLTQLEAMDERLEQIEQKTRELTTLRETFDNFETTEITQKTAEVFKKRTDSRHHQVRVGDTLYNISRRYGLTVDELRRINGLAPGALIYPNQKLIVDSDK